MHDVDNEKRLAAARALDFVEPGMTVGLGTGSTAAVFVELLGGRARGGLDVVGVPTSVRTRELAASCGLRLASLDEVASIDVTVDGADEIDPGLRLVKGGGGALLYEKLVALASRSLVVIADSTKRVDVLGRFPLAVEVVPYGWKFVRDRVARLGVAPSLKADASGAPFRTDEGNFILTCPFGRIEDPEALAAALKAVPGVVEHGLFIGIAATALVGTDEGVVVVTAPAGNSGQR